MRQETGSWRWVLFGIGMMLLIALGAAVLVYQTCQWFGWGVIHA
jgi:Fe2+ transport system protein B